MTSRVLYIDHVERGCLRAVCLYYRELSVKVSTSSVSAILDLANIPNFAGGFTDSGELLLLLLSTRLPR